MVHTGRGRQFYLACSVAARPPASLTWTQRPGRRRAPGHQADMAPMLCWMMIRSCLQIISVSPNIGNRSATRSLSGATRATSSSAMSLLPTLASTYAEPTTPSGSLQLALWSWVRTTRSVSNVWQCLEASSNNYQTSLTCLNTLCFSGQ